MLPMTDVLIQSSKICQSEFCPELNFIIDAVAARGQYHGPVLKHFNFVWIHSRTKYNNNVIYKP